MITKGAWSFLLLLAISVASYAVALLLSADLRSNFVQQLISTFPYIAPIHFIGGALAIVVGALQFPAWIRRKHLTLHRYLGRTYVIAIFFSGIAGLILAVNSVAGPVAQSGFALMAIVWMMTTGLAFMSIRRGEINAHKQWMMRSYAVTVAGVTLRLYLGIGFAAGLSFSEFYPYLAWLCWVPNLVLMELYLRISSGGDFPLHAEPIEKPLSLEPR